MVVTTGSNSWWLCSPLSDGLRGRISGYSVLTAWSNGGRINMAAALGSRASQRHEVRCNFTGHHRVVGRTRSCNLITPDAAAKQQLISPLSYGNECLPGAEMGNSVGGSSVPLLYRPYMDYLWTTLAQKAPGFHSLPLELDMRHTSSQKGKDRARVFNWLFTASRLRRIRFTYFDSGDKVQAFNSILYPDFRYDIPLLGIDMLIFGNNKVLCAIDFIPLSMEDEYLDKYTKQLTPIRANIADDCGRMTTKFYDESQFFSKELIFYRSSLGAGDPILEIPNGKLFSAYVGYLEEYINLLYEAKSNEDPLEMSHVCSRQIAYNKYSEERDPAIKLFNSYFGKEWGERFTKDFLFPQTPLT